MEFLSRITDWIKLAPRYLFAVFLFCCFLLFLPDTVLQKIGIDDLRNRFLPWIGGMFLMLLFTHGLATAWHWLHYRIKQRNSLKHRLQRLQNLTPKEDEILCWFIINKTRTQNLRYDSGVVTGLISANVLHYASNRATSSWNPADVRIDVNIQPWAWEYLNKHPEILKGYLKKSEVAIEHTKG